MRTGAKRASQAGKQASIGLDLVIVALVMFFWWGIHFELFGQRIRLTLPNFGFFGWIALGAFGMGYAPGGVRAGLKAAGSFAALAAIGLAIGIALGNYG